ncbi:XRE family transcriptional regulator [Altericroceibacterium endophyticum]|uniref:Helix-turn-helix domain-containing protein n=1 Tax=Altericroceibacterium endophyticum TaxID=1808508 RepID=A0A6I4T8T2_9SPHN|nr:S24 family peptidase [Altericroceibacterium endophyticum]MXO66270.1 helix-turn-helix domain-containing protein [Altericroceibacterium endophyticum]
MRTGERIAELRKARELSQTQLAKLVGLSQATIGKLESGISSGSSHLHKIARALGTTGEYLTGETDDPDAGALPAISPQALADQLDLVEVQEIDLRFGLGATELEVPVTKQVRHFSRDWLRHYTSANPEDVYFAQGSGDSMMPTILDSDLLLIDTSQKNMTMSDKIWAVAYAGSGMIKRLRATPEGVKILSDNQAIPPEMAYDGELHILGRLVGIVRKM